VDRNEIKPEHFKNWIDWAKSLGIGLDFNPTCFSHPKAADGFTLSTRTRASASSGSSIARPAARSARRWARRSAPDGHERLDSRRHEGHARRPRGPRERLAESLDEVFKKPLDPKAQPRRRRGQAVRHRRESYTVGMHEFYLGYAVKNQKLVCLDAGHYHPTENMADKISSVLCFVPEILLHVSRGVRWDSDHVVILDDALQAIAQELVRGDYLGRTHIGLDFFDASINRVAAWTIGARNMLRALCIAMLDPVDKLKKLEAGGRLHLAPRVDGRGQDHAVRRGLGLLLRKQKRPRRRTLAGGGEKI
jgi:L-rhamnose isomerase